MRVNFDEFDQHVLQKIEQRRVTGTPYEELFEELYDISLSPTESRKELRGIENHLNNKKEQNNKKENQEENIKYKECVEINSDGRQTSDKLIRMSENESKDVNFLLKAHGYDINVWELLSARNNIWNVNDKIHGIQTLFSSKIVVKPKILKFDIQWIKDALESCDLSGPVVSSKPYNVYGKTLELNIADVHIDKLCMIDETKNEYSTEIGIQRLHNVVNDIIEKTKTYKLKKIIFPFGQDIANIDNIFNTTTKGTPQDTDVKYDVLYKLLLENIIKIIYKLAEIAPVEIIYVGGNHDKITSFTMSEAIYWHFLNNDNVEADTIFNNRKYRLIGNSLLGLAHGSDEKKNIIYCMQNDVPGLWGKAKFKEFHLSHFHKEKIIDEQNGIIFRWISSISGTDAWTYNSGFVGNQKKAQAFLWDDIYGLEAIFNSYI